MAWTTLHYWHDNIYSRPSLPTKTTSPDDWQHPPPPPPPRPQQQQQRRGSSKSDARQAPPVTEIDSDLYRCGYWWWGAWCCCCWWFMVLLVNVGDGGPAVDGSGIACGGGGGCGGRHTQRQYKSECSGRRTSGLHLQHQYSCYTRLFPSSIVDLFFFRIQMFFFFISGESDGCLIYCRPVLDTVLSEKQWLRFQWIKIIRTPVVEDYETLVHHQSTFMYRCRI